MIDIICEKDCCGCMACIDICPKQCITTKKGTLGAIFPKVNIDQCINCGQCEKVCPMKETEQCDVFEHQVAYASYSNNKEIRYQSSSGGMFSVFSYILIQEGYKVYGAAFDDHMVLRHQMSDSQKNIVPLCKSKYLQSDMQGIYREIKSLLENRDKVLFVGTPCQGIALKRFLKKNYDNLIIVDFFCHGVPSQDFFDKSLHMEEYNKSKITSYSFRTKIKNGSTPHYYTITRNINGKEYKETKLYFYSKFYAAFQSYINLRESCYNCIFSGRNRMSDITIGDFHGINKYIKDIDRFDGISTVIINSKKGRELWDKCSDRVTSYEFSIEQLIDDKQIFSGGTERPPHRDKFIEDYNNMPFNEVMKKYFPLKKYWKQMIYYKCPKPIRDILKKLGRV